MRKAEADGGFAALLERGDDTSGSVVVILEERGAAPRILERLLQKDRYSWQEGAVSARAEIFERIARKKHFDPDLWVLELNVPSAERFAAEMKLLD